MRFLISLAILVAAAASATANILDPFQHPTPVLEARQQPGVISPDKFLRRAYHAVAVAGKYLYIDGGQFSYENNGSVVYDYASSTLSLDLSVDWDNSSVALAATAKQDGVPDLNYGRLWYHQSQDLLYGGLVGPTSNPDAAVDATPPAPSLWSFKPDNTGSGTWQQALAPNDPSLKHLTRPLQPFAAATADTAFVINGDQAVNNSYMVRFDMNNKTLTNTTSAGTNALGANGLMQYVPVFGPEGILVAFGGHAINGTENDFGTILVYDPSSQQWYNQTTTGNKPSPRVEACAAGVASTQNTYEIFVYGGQNGNLGQQAVPYDTINILTLPAFHWISVPYNPQYPRRGHTCTAVGGSQILVVGGADADPQQTYGDYGKIALSCMSSRDNNTQGLAIFDMSAMSWSSKYLAAPGPYNSALAIQQYYTQANGSYNASLTKGVSALMKQSNFTASTSNPTSGNSTSTPMPPTPAKSHAGAIAGGVVGGVAGLAIIAAAVFFLLRRKRKAKQTNQAPANDNPIEDMYQSHHGSHVSSVAGANIGAAGAEPKGYYFAPAPDGKGEDRWFSELHPDPKGPAELHEDSRNVVEADGGDSRDTHHQRPISELPAIDV